MKLLRVSHPESGKVLGERVEFANSATTRLLGLMFRTGLEGIDGLLLQPCNAIHTFFMRFPIDVVFMTSSGEVVKVIRSMKPWRHSWMYLRAVKVLELKAGTIPPEVREGSRLEVAHV